MQEILFSLTFHYDETASFIPVCTSFLAQIGMMN